MPKNENDNEKNIKSNSVVFITTLNLLKDLNIPHNCRKYLLLKLLLKKFYLNKSF